MYFGLETAGETESPRRVLIRNQFYPRGARVADQAQPAVPLLRAFLVSPAFRCWARQRDSVGRSRRLPGSVGCGSARCLCYAVPGERCMARRRSLRSRLLDFSEQRGVTDTRYQLFPVVSEGWAKQRRNVWTPCPNMLHLAHACRASRNGRRSRLFLCGGQCLATGSPTGALLRLEPFSELDRENGLRGFRLTNVFDLGRRLVRAGSWGAVSIRCAR